MSINNPLQRLLNRNYILVFILIVVSGNPLAIYSSEWIYAGYVVVLLVYLMTIQRFVLSKYVCKWLLGFLILFFAQLIYVRTVSIPADINFVAKFIIAYLTAWICGKKFCETYLNLMYIICLISLIFYFLCCINIKIPGLFFDRYITLGIWNYIERFSYRNCGMFWEPGAFQGFIMLTFLFYIGKLKWFWKCKRRQIIIFILALLSTLSTTAYAVAFAYIFLLLMRSKINPIYKVFLVSIALLTAVYAFFSIDFLGEKIQGEVEQSEITGENQVSWSRTGAMIIELSNISRHPFVGNGFLLNSRYKGFGDAMSGAGNGLFGFINMFGLPMALAYFFGVAYTWRAIPRSYRQIVIFVLILLLFGEFFLNYPLFWGLLFIKLPYEKTEGIRNCGK